MVGASWAACATHQLQQAGREAVRQQLQRGRVAAEVEGGESGQLPGQVSGQRDVGCRQAQPAQLAPRREVCAQPQRRGRLSVQRAQRRPPQGLQQCRICGLQALRLAHHMVHPPAHLARAVETAVALAGRRPRPRQPQPPQQRPPRRQPGCAALRICHADQAQPGGGPKPRAGAGQRLQPAAGARRPHPAGAVGGKRA